MTTFTSLSFAQTTRDGVLILELRGPLDSALALDPVVEAALQASAQNVIVVLSDVDYINSAGFGALVRMSELVTQSAKAIYVVGLQAKVHVVFDSLGAHHLFNILPGLDEALARIKSASKP